MTTDPRRFADDSVVETEAMTAARSRAADSGLTPPSPATGATLRLLARLIDARNVVEVGTGSGLSALWLLQGMAEDGVVTSIDPEAEHHRLARQAFADAAEPARRTRLIPGRPHEVLPRLTDGGYDVVLLDRDPRAWLDYAVEALRLLRPGGMLLAHGALWGDKVADPAIRDPDTVAVREFLRQTAAGEDYEGVLLPVGSGLFAALRR